MLFPISILSYVNFHSTLLGCGCIPAVDKYLTVFNDVTKDGSREEFVDTGMLNSQCKPPLHTTKEHLSERADKALQSKYLELFRSPLPSYKSHPKYVYGNVAFATRIESKHDCNIIFQLPDNKPVPGIIQFITSIPA